MKFSLASILFLSMAAFSAGTDTNALPPLTPAYPEIPPTFWEQHESAIIVATFAVLTFAFFFLKTALRPESPKIPPPATVARQALAKLQNQPEDGKVLSEISQILRRYLGETFNLPNQERTMSEFCSALADDANIGAELAGIAASFLRECDVRKFSPALSATPLNAAGRALEIIVLGEKRGAELMARAADTK